MFIILNKISLLSVIIFAACSQSVFAQAQEPDTVQPQNSTTLKVSEDGTINVQISSNLPKANSPLVINLRFSDAKTGNDLSDINYDMIAMQNGEVVLSQLGLYATDGRAQHVTSPLSTDNQVDVIVILQGIGKNAPYVGPQGETIETTVVPEFGVIAPVVLLLAVSLFIIVQKTIPPRTCHNL